MECQGVVTDVNPVFLFFVLDNDKKIHMSTLLIESTSQKLPTVGSQVYIQNAHRQSSTYSVCKSSTLNGDFSVDYHKSFFYNLMKDYKLGFTDLLNIDSVADQIYNSYPTLSEDLKTNFIISILQSSNEDLRTSSEEHICLNKHISVNFITVSKCRYVEIQPERNKFENFPHWSFGVHSKPTNDTVLFGCIKVQPVYGFLMIGDHHYQIPCLIYNTSSDAINSLENAYVLIKKYTVVTEIYQENNIPNIEYLIIDFSDVKVIYKEQNTVSLYGKVLPSNHTFKNGIYFQLIRKSMVCIGNKMKPECWLQILVKNKTIELNEIFLILPSTYIKIILYFEEGHHYKLFYNDDLEETQNAELARIKKIKIYELQDGSAFFQKLNETLKPEKLLTVKECKEYLLNNTEMVSFEGVLKGRRFANALSSRTRKRTNIYGFGTPGLKVHQLVFSINENGNTVYMDCYLNNWENILMPLGLIPQMKLIVRNVYPQSKKYLKSSIFTTFEIVAYEPLVHFDTVNLYENDHLQWGHKFFIGQGNKIPHGVLVWGTVCNIQILSLRMSNQCQNCKAVIEMEGPCTRCGKNEKEFNFLIKMHVSDEFGQSKILGKSPEIMKIFLCLQDNQFEIWLKTFKEIGQYEYSFFEDIETDGLPEHYYFKDSLTEFLKSFNKYSMLFLDLKCRKLDCDPQKNGGRPLWFYVDARRH